MNTKQSPLKGMLLGNIATVAISELAGLPAIDLRVAPGTSTHAKIAETLGGKLTRNIGQVENISTTGSDDGHVLRLGPDWWLIIGSAHAEQKPAPLLQDNDTHFSAVDVSSQRTTIQLEGPHAREVLAHLWEQDLRDKPFPAGSVSQGLMAKSPVIVWHVSPLRYRIMVRSSFALHLWKSLVDAAEEWL